jgi:hypothetical protein
MYQIWKWITRPQDLQEHRHKSTLQDIGRNVEASAVPVHISKVKSHIGTTLGKETTDKTAVGVANGTLCQYERSDDNSNQLDTSLDSTDEEERQGTYGSLGLHQGLYDDWWHYYKHSNDREDQYWPHHLHLQLEDAKRAPWLTGHHQNTLRKTYHQEQQKKATWRQCQQVITTISQPGSGMTPESTPCRLLGPTGMVGGVETSLSHTPTFLDDYAGSNVQPSVTTHSLTHHLDIMLPTTNGEEQAGPITVYTTIPTW